jgi:transcriptional regulator with XRE-family HTH domain
MNKSEIARRLGVSKSYITMIAKGERKLSSKLAHKVHKLGLDFEINNHIHIQGVRGSNPLLPTMELSNFDHFNPGRYAWTKETIQ